MKSSYSIEDQQHCWHPFTPMQQWCDPHYEPLVLVKGQGALLEDEQGRQYLDGNSSIWTNLHGHNHPTLNAAIRQQLDQVAHLSFLGTTHPPAIELARQLKALFPGNQLSRVFFSDNGSTAVEVALKMAAQYRQLNGEKARQHFIAFSQAYHGDTLGAASLGDLFQDRFSHLRFPIERLESVEALEQYTHPESITAVILEPLVQGAAGIRLWPSGMLRRVHKWCQQHDIFLILDEVLTGFGRTGTLFACEQEQVVPDFIALAKGLTGGYLPLAATLTTERVFEKFLGPPEEQKTFYYGHSYTANPLGCAAALANLKIFEQEAVLEKIQHLIALLRVLLHPLTQHPKVKEVRQCGLIVGIELIEHKGRDQSYPWTQLKGVEVCAQARKWGLLTRPILDTLVLMPPYCIEEEQLRRAVHILEQSITKVCR